MSLKQLRLHLHRGVGYMAVHGFIKCIDDFVRLTKEVSLNQHIVGPE